MHRMCRPQKIREAAEKSREAAEKNREAAEKSREAAGKSSKYCIRKAVTGIQPVKRDSCGSFFHY